MLKMTNPARNKHFWMRLVSLLVAEAFFCSSILPVWGEPFCHSSHLRPSASDGANRKDLIQDLRETEAAQAASVDTLAAIPVRNEVSNGARDGGVKRIMSRLAVGALGGALGAALLVGIAHHEFATDQTFKGWPHAVNAPIVPIGASDLIRQLRPVRGAPLLGVGDPSRPYMTEKEFQRGVDYYRALKDGPVRPIAIEDLEALLFAQEALKDLVPHFQESGRKHNVPPTMLAAAALHNLMFKAKRPIYDLGGGGEIIQFYEDHDLGIFSGSPKESYEGPGWIKGLVKVVPERIRKVRVQDRATDYLGGIWGGFPLTMGLMQIRASRVLHEDLWDPWPSGVSKEGTSQEVYRGINRKLLDPEWNIEAAAARWGNYFDKFRRAQEEGKSTDVPPLNQLEGGWLNAQYDPSTGVYGPDPLTTAGLESMFYSRQHHDEFQRMEEDALSWGLDPIIVDAAFGIAEPRLPRLHILVHETGLFDPPDRPVPGIIVGVTTTEEVRKIAELLEQHHPYLRDAALRSLIELEGSRTLGLRDEARRAADRYRERHGRLSAELYQEAITYRQMVSKDGASRFAQADEERPEAARDGADQAVILEPNETANPLSSRYQPWLFEIATPAGQTKKVTVVDLPSIASGLRKMGYDVDEVSAARALAFFPENRQIPKEIQESDVLVVPGKLGDVENYGFRIASVYREWIPVFVKGEEETARKLSERLNNTEASLPPVFEGDGVESIQIMNALERMFDRTGKGHVSIRYPVNRVAGEGKLWEKIPGDIRHDLERLYQVQYELFERRKENVLKVEAVRYVIRSLNHENRAVASAARDVIVAVRAYGLKQTLERLAKEYEKQKPGFGPYAKRSYIDALETLIDPTYQIELGNPHRPLFEGDVDVQKIHRGVQFLFDRNRRDTWLKSFSGIRGPFSLAMDTDGFPVVDLQTDIGSQITDASKVASAHIIREFARRIPKMRERAGLPPKPKLRIGVMSDTRYTGPAIVQTIARTLLQSNVEVVFGGIAGAPETAAYALLSEGEVDAVAYISSSHVQEGTNGFKLMLWSGQILPIDEAKQFIADFVESAKEIRNTEELIGLLSDASVNGELETIMRQMPATYAESKRRYHGYGDQVISGRFERPEVVAAAKREIYERLLGQKVVLLYDANGGAGMTDILLLRGWAPYLITMNDQARRFAHDLPPWEAATRQAQDLASALESELEKRGYTLVIFGTDPDRDRRYMLFRKPAEAGKQHEYFYPGPQALFMIDAIYHVLTNRARGKEKIALVGNDPTTPRLEILSRRMGYEMALAEVGEANVVAAMRQFIEKGYETMGGEGSNASTIRHPVMVRDLLLALGSVFGFMGNRTLVEDLIRLVAPSEERETLLAQVDEWYKTENLPDLFYHILYDILPPEKVTDTFDVSEARKGIGIPQERFKDALDTYVQEDLMPVIRPLIAEEIGAASGTPVSPSQITYKIVSQEGIERMEGPGNRETQEGGYRVELYYTDSADQTHFLGWLWIRESQTELGTARRLVAMVNDFLPRKQGRQLVERLYDRLYPKWIDALNFAETRALQKMIGEETEPSALRRLSESAEETRQNTVQIISELTRKHADPADRANYSENVARNLNEEGMRVKGGQIALETLLSKTVEAIARLSTIEQTLQENRQMSHQQASRLNEAVEIIRNAARLTARRRSNGIDVAPPETSLSRGDDAFVAAQNLMIESFRFKVERILEGIGTFAEGPVDDRQFRKLDALSELDSIFRTIADRPKAHYPHVHLIAAEMLLAPEGAKAGDGASRFAQADEGPDAVRDGGERAVEYESLVYQLMDRVQTMTSDWRRTDPPFEEVLFGTLASESRFSTLIEEYDIDLSDLAFEGTAGTTRHPLLSYMSRLEWERVLAEIFDNAFHAMAESPIRRLTIETGTDQAGDFLRISDIGSGILPEDLPKIWSRDYSRKPNRIQGIGSGLPTVEEIVEDHHGMVSVESEIGEGTTLTIRFPIPGVSGRDGGLRAIEVPGAGRVKIYIPDIELSPRLDP